MIIKINEIVKEKENDKNNRKNKETMIDDQMYPENHHVVRTGPRRVS